MSRIKQAMEFEENLPIYLIENFLGTEKKRLEKEYEDLCIIEGEQYVNFLEYTKEKERKEIADEYENIKIEIFFGKKIINYRVGSLTHKMINHFIKLRGKMSRAGIIHKKLGGNLNTIKTKLTYLKNKGFLMRCFRGYYKINEVVKNV